MSAMHEAYTASFEIVTTWLQDMITVQAYNCVMFFSFF